MKLKHWMTAKAIVCIVFGLGFVLFPMDLMSFYEVKLEEAGAMMTQLLGASFIVLGMLLWLMRYSTEPATRRAFALSVLVGDLIGGVAALLAQLAGAVGALGWTTVVIYFALALGFGYFLIAKSA